MKGVGFAIPLLYIYHDEKVRKNTIDPPRME